MTKNRIVGAISALALLAVPAVAVAHGNGDDHGHHSGRHHHHRHHAKIREVTGAATGTVASFANGELTIALPNGKSFAADVTDRTAILCVSAPTTATAARHGNDDGDDNRGRGRGNDDGADHDAGDDHGDDPATSTAPASTTVPPSTTVPAPTTGDDDPGHDANDDHGNDHGVRCGTDALVAGTKVLDAKLSLKGGSATWQKIKLLK